MSYNTTPEVHQIQYMCTLLYQWSHPLYVMSRSVWLIPLVSLPNPHFYVINTSTEVHIIQYMYSYYITDPSPICNSQGSVWLIPPGQSAWSLHLCHIYINRSPSNTIYMSLLYPLTHPLYVMSRSVWPINMVSMVNSHMFIEIHKSWQNLYNKFVVTVCRHNGHYWYCATHIGQM